MNLIFISVRLKTISNDNVMCLKQTLSNFKTIDDFTKNWMNKLSH